MNNCQSSGSSPVHQTVAERIVFKSAGHAIQIQFTDQQLSAHAGTAVFWTFLRQSGWIGLLRRCLPHPLPRSNNRILPVSKALGFIHGLLCGAKKLTQVAYLRRDPVVPELARLPLLDLCFDYFRDDRRRNWLRPRHRALPKRV